MSDYYKENDLELQKAVSRMQVVEKNRKYAEHGKAQKIWESHIESNRKAILRAMRIADERHGGSGPKTAVILGAGTCLDIPLREMIEDGYNAILVDIDRPAMEQAIEKLPVRTCSMLEVDMGKGRYVSVGEQRYVDALTLTRD